MTAKKELVPKGNLLVNVAATYGFDPEEFKQTIMATAFKAVKTQGEFMAMLSVCRELGLNPLLSEVYAMRDKHGVLKAMVGVDGYNRKAQEHPAYAGFVISYSEETVQAGEVPGLRFECPAWLEAAVYRTDRQYPATARCYIAQSYRDTAAWRDNPTWMMEQRALARSFKLGFGLSGVVLSEDEVDQYDSAGGADFTIDPVIEQSALEGLLELARSRGIEDPETVLAGNLKFQAKYEGPLSEMTETMAQGLRESLLSLPEVGEGEEGAP